MDDLIFIQRALNRTKDYNIDTSNTDNIIVFLEKKLEYAEGQIHNYAKEKMEAIVEEQKRVDKKYIEILESLKTETESTAAEIIKALSDNGYNTITINCYKYNESEG